MKTVFEVKADRPSVGMLERLTSAEIAVIVAGMELLLLHGNKAEKWSAEVIMENDYEFVRRLFRTSAQ